MGHFPPIARLGRNLYRELFGESLNHKWRIKWVNMIKESGYYNKNVLGLCRFNPKTIELAWDLNPKRGRKWGFLNKRINGPLHTLLHEFIHVRHPLLRHGKKFNKIMKETWERFSQIQI